MVQAQLSQDVLKIRTTGKSFHNITSQVEAAIAASGVQTGLCTLFIRHTSASLVIQENADPDVLKDLGDFFADLVPESRRYFHSTEGADDMPAHIRSVLTNTSEQIPIAKGRLVLGTWQGIYLWEHRARGHERQVFVHISGD
ncbi:MAG: YjbQ family protein [Kamptonema sp. SIO4C4]|nr:YjbQ family protein [Kamptonema sp. SIO4C4]